jgi:endonuclease-3
VTGKSRTLAKHKKQAQTADRAVAAIRRFLGQDQRTAVTRLAQKKRDPFRILISTMLSLRTKDEVTFEASRRLFELADTPEALSRLPVKKIEKLIYPVGFYHTKAQSIRAVAKKLLADHNGIVPDTIEELVGFKGVGRKTANLVITLGYGKPGICVDTHVHRISNRLGIVDTSTPDHTEFALREVLPKKHWIGYNELLVLFGQQVCKPISPHCSTCELKSFCPRIGVGRRR